jgi:pimeloyl-ACP methyl ester carboxylesterase
LSLTVFEPAAFHLLPLDHAGRIEIETVVAGILRTDSEHEATRIFIDYWNRPGTFEFIGSEQRDKFAAQIAKVKLDFQALLGERASLADMAQLNMPVLVLSGQTSPESTRALAQLLTAVLPNGTTAQTKGGHMAPLTHAYLVNPVIADFLNAIATKLKHSED